MQITFLNTKTGEQLAMPVTPPDFAVEIGRDVENLDMAQTGQVNLPGLEALFNETQEFLLPSEARNYTSSGYSGEPYTVVETLTRWSLAGDVLRYIVTETPVNVPVLLGRGRDRPSDAAAVPGSGGRDHRKSLHRQCRTQHTSGHQSGILVYREEGRHPLGHCTEDLRRRHPGLEAGQL